MPTPLAAYSLGYRVELAPQPGALPRLVTAVETAGGSIEGLRVHHHAADGDRVPVDLVVHCTDEAHMAAVAAAVEGVDGLRLVEAVDRTFALHQGGKVELRSKVPVTTSDDLAMAYTPGVARVCLAIARNPALAYDLTIKRNTVAVVTDGTAVLGLGDIGPEAALPVMEGKALLFKEFAGIDAFPVCLRVSSTDELVEAVERLAPTFGGINLEDIAAPRCFEVEERLRHSLDIPVFHDDQHGTAIVTLAALRSAVQVVGHRLGDLRVVIAGAGAAGVAITKILKAAGVSDIVACDRLGALVAGRAGLEAPSKRWLAEHANPRQARGSLAEVMIGADAFIGVSGPGLVSADDVAAMAPKPIVFAMANPDPEVRPESIQHIAAVIATGRSDFPNQINNVLAFPGVFRGALHARATSITDGMEVAAAEAISSCVSADDLDRGVIVPSVFDPRVVGRVAEAVAVAAHAAGVTRPAPG
ncbi:MAG: NAD-dependent malic enzyme [Acidimicrobiales bacterium]